MDEITKIIETLDVQQVNEFIDEKKDLISEDKSLLSKLDNYGDFPVFDIRVGLVSTNTWDVIMYATDEERKQLNAIVKAIISRQIETQTKIVTDLSNRLQE